MPLPWALLHSITSISCTKTNGAERNSGALRYSWAPAPGTERCAAQQRKTSTSSSHRGGELRTTQTSPEAQVRGKMLCVAGHPPTLIPLLLPWSSCHQPFSSPAFKILPSSSLGQICSLHHAFALWHWHSHGRKTEVSQQSASLCLSVISSQTGTSQRDTRCVCVCMHMCIRV